MVPLLLKSKCDVNDQEFQRGLTPIHIAAVRGRMELLEQLMKESDGSGIPVHAKDGSTPLHLAVKGGHLDTMEVTFNKGFP